MFKSGLLIAALAYASGSLAQPIDTAPPRTESVTFADLDLGSTAGKLVLRRRIKIAAGHVCDMGGMGRMEDFHVATQCYRTAVADALDQMNNLLASKVAGVPLSASVLVISGK